MLALAGSAQKNAMAKAQCILNTKNVACVCSLEMENSAVVEERNDRSAVIEADGEVFEAEK